MERIKILVVRGIGYIEDMQENVHCLRIWRR